MAVSGLAVLKGVRRISISLPPSLLKNFEETAKQVGYRERSGAIQASMRNFISEFQWMKHAESEGSAAILLIYDHGVRGLDEKLTDIQHEHHDLVSSTLHVHLDDRTCLASIITKGSSSDIRELSERLAKLRGILQLKVSYFEQR